MTIRPATPSDAKIIARLSKDARNQAMPWLPDLHSYADDCRFFENRVLPNETVLIANVDDTPAGFIAYHNGWVNHLYLDQGFWRLGIGSNLLDYAKASTDYLQLWTFQQNHAARKFYAAQGFSEVELTDGRNNQEKTPDVRLEWVKHS